MSARRLFPLMGLMVAGLALPTVVSGQGLLRMEVTPSNIVFPMPGVPQFDAGWVDHGTVAVEVQSRPPARPWVLHIRAVDPELGPGKPVSDMLWRRAGTATWTPLTGTETFVVEGTGDQSVTLELRVLLDWATDGAGTYSTGLDFILARQ
jgi:hypothetical protein